MIDTRLLWSVFLRDAIFHYFITYFDVFDAEDKSRTSATAKPPQSSMVPQTSFNYSTPNSKTTALDSDRSHEKASLADFLREEKQRIPMGLLAQIKTPRRLGGDELQVPHDEEECLLPAVSTDDAGVAALERVSGGGGSRRGPSRALYRVVQDTSMQSHFLSNLKKGNTTLGGLSSRKRPQSPRELRRTRSGLGQPSRSIRGPLFSRLTEKEKDQLETESRCSG